MNRRHTISAAASMLVIAAAVATTPATAAYSDAANHPDIGELCASGSLPVSISLLSAKYARHFTVQELRSMDVNRNGDLCVVRGPARTGREGTSNFPMGFTDDQF